MITDENQSKREELQQLALDAKDGDRQALAELLTHPAVKRSLHCIANKMVGHDLAEDVYQDVCMLISKSIHTWQQTAQITSWMNRIAINCCYSIQQHQKKEQRKRQHWSHLTGLNHRQEPEQFFNALENERREIVHSALQTMKQSCQQMMMLYFFHRTRKEEIMQALQVKKTQFYIRWKQCYRMLTQNVQEILQNGRK